MKIFYGILALLLIVLILIFLVSQFGNITFQKKAEEEISRILSEKSEKDPKIISEDDLNDLPEPVARWMRFSQVVGKENIKTLRLKQSGLMRIKPGQTGMKTTAVQYFNTENPSFVWLARVNMAPFIFFAGKDKYENGRGQMLIKALSILTVVDAEGKEIDQGTLTRYLGEIIWFPTTALSDYISWEEIDDYSAQAKMSYRGVSASAVFNFDQKGRVKSFNCDRYYSGEEGYSLKEYYAPVWDYQEFAGIKIPTQAKAIWKLKSGDYEYYEMKITEIDYNIEDLY